MECSDVVIYSLRPPQLFTLDGDTETKIMYKKRVKFYEKWVKWWDLSIFNNRFDIVEESSGCNSSFYC